MFDFRYVWIISNLTIFRVPPGHLEPIPEWPLSSEIIMNCFSRIYLSKSWSLTPRLSKLGLFGIWPFSGFPRGTWNRFQSGHFHQKSSWIVFLVFISQNHEVWHTDCPNWTFFQFGHYVGSPGAFGTGFKVANYPKHHIGGVLCWVRCFSAK